MMPTSIAVEQAAQAGDKQKKKVVAALAG